MDNNEYETPKLTELGLLSQVTEGQGGSSNDGQGGGAGMAGSFNEE